MAGEWVVVNRASILTGLNHLSCGHGRDSEHEHPGKLPRNTLSTMPLPPSQYIHHVLSRQLVLYNDGMTLFRSVACLSALTMLASFSQAYILIEDFTVGEYHTTINWPNTSDGHEERNLDRNHSIYGYRATNLSILNNFDHVPVHFDTAGGVQRVAYSSHSVASQLDTAFGGNGFGTVDFSAESQFMVDVFSENPQNRFADTWVFRAIDSNDKAASNGFALSRQGGIYFRKSDFVGQVDWSKIKYLSFSQEFTPDIGTVPLAYGATKIYAVPEPSVSLAALCILIGLPLRARTRNGRSS